MINRNVLEATEIDVVVDTDKGLYSHYRIVEETGEIVEKFGVSMEGERFEDFIYRLDI